MILRRIAQHMKQQHWTAFFFELAVVVLGVFIGLQVDNWNDARRDRIDEQRYLVRIHADILRAEALSKRVRARRLERLAPLKSASETIFRRDGRDELSDEECSAVASNHFYNLNVLAYPAVTELMNAGRMGIISDARLRAALIDQRQSEEVLQFYISIQSAGADDLPARFPDLIKLDSYFDPDMGEVRFHARCDLEGIRTNQSFLNEFSENVDRYDAWVQDALAPWIKKSKKVHELVDSALDIRHEEARP
jgi:hypothetical protein